MDFIRSNFTSLLPIGIGVFVSLSLIPFFKILRGLRKGSAEAQRLLREGSSSEAKVVQLQPTGTMINNQPVTIVTLEVQGASKYQVTTQTIVNQLFIPQIQPGKIVPIKIDPQDRNNVILDTSQLGSNQIA